MPRVSVIISCYNYGRYLDECLRSVFAQDWGPKDWEVIVVDDGSTDDTAERAAAWREVRYVRQENQGQGEAINAGFRASSGDILCFHDADDLWYPAKLRRVLETFAKHPEAGFVQHPLDAGDAAMELLWRATRFPPPEVRLEDVLAGRAQLIGAPGLAMRRRVFEKVYPVPRDLPYCSDEYVSKHALLHAPGRTLLEILGRFRVHERNSYQRTDYDAAKIERWLAVRGRLDHYFDRALEERGLDYAPSVRLEALLERRKREILMHAWRGERRKAYRVWTALAGKVPAGSFGAFKRWTLLLACLSPRLYLGLHEFYAQVAWLPRLRMRFFKGFTSL